MLILLPPALLILAAAAILVLQRLRPNSGIAWVIAALGSLAAWGAAMFLRLRLPTEALLTNWQPPTLFRWSPALLLDYLSWPYLAAIASLSLAVILTDPVRLQGKPWPRAWSGSLALAALGMLAVTAGNQFTLMLAWTALDVVEVIILLIPSGEQRFSRQVVLSFSARVAGTMAVWLSIRFAGQGGIYDLASVPAESGLFLLLAAGLRLGVLPFHLPFSEEVPLRRGLGNVLRLIPAASSLMLLARLPANAVPPAWQGLLLLLAALAAIYASIMWLIADNEMNGRASWVIGMAALAVISVLRGYPGASAAWGSALLLPGGMLLLYSARSRYSLFLPVLGLWSLSGLPFSLAAEGWVGLVGGGLTLSGIAALAAFVLMAAGYARHALGLGEHALSDAERWAQVLYPLGLLALPLTAQAMAIWGWPGSRTLGVWYASLPAAVLAALLVLHTARLGALFSPMHLPETGWAAPLAVWLLPRLRALISLEWLYRLAEQAYSGLRVLVNGLSATLEGEGGVLWAMLLMALLLSLLGARGGG